MLKGKSSVHITTSQHRICIRVIYIIFSLAYILIVFQLYRLQCIYHEKYLAEAEKQHYKNVAIPAKRGAIFDRNGNVLAVSVDLYDVVCSPNAIAQVKNNKDKRKKNIDLKLAKELTPILQLSEKKLLTTFNSDTKSKHEIVAKEIGVTQQEQISAILMKYLIQYEIELKPVPKRLYPKAELACHVIGPVGFGCDDTTINIHQENLGLYGIERKQQKTISGSYTRSSCLQDYRGRLLSPVDYTSLLSVEGNQLYLTIDETIQHAAERELHNAVEKNKAVGGCIVVMDPFTGEILALANYPNFDLNRYRDIAKNAEVWKRVSRNEAVEGVVEPGSTAKIFTAAAALEENKVKLTDRFFGYNGKVVFCNRILRDSHPYGWLTFPEIIKVSSNIGIHQVAQRMSPVTLRKYITQFGFGNRTGIELPGESYGLVPGLRQWTPLTMSRISFGQSISMSPIQLTSAVAAIANGGILMKPHVVKSVYDAQGRKTRESTPEPIHRVISYTTATTLTAIMEGVVEEGTGKAAKLALFRVAGKTGTAQVPLENAKGYKRGKYNASFVGFVPADAPRVVILVVLNEPSGGLYYGGTIAAPVFKAVAEEALTQLGIHPSLPPVMNPGGNQTKLVAKLNKQDIPVSTSTSTILRGSDRQDGLVLPPAGSPVTPGATVQMVSYTRDTSSPEFRTVPIMPDVLGLSKRKVALLIAPYQMRVRFIGSGVAVEQIPAPGDELKIGTPCIVHFAANGLN